MKFINLDGLTTAERLVVLENICNDIIAHLNKETLYTTVDEYNSSTLNYDITKLNPKTDVLPESGQLVYFSNGYVGIIGNIDTIGNTYGVSEVNSIKGEKGDTGDDALEYSGMYETANFPMKGDLIQDNNSSNYSRNPKTGDKIIICGFTNTTPKRSFMCLCTRTPDADIAWSVNNVVETTGEKGEPGTPGKDGETPTFYRHIINSTNGSGFSFAAVIISKKSDEYGFADIINFLVSVECNLKDRCYPCSGFYKANDVYYPTTGLWVNSGFLMLNAGTMTTSITSFTDTVSEIS